MSYLIQCDVRECAPSVQKLPASAQYLGSGPLPEGWIAVAVVDAVADEEALDALRAVHGAVPGLAPVVRMAARERPVTTIIRHACPECVSKRFPVFKPPER